MEPVRDTVPAVTALFLLYLFYAIIFSMKETMEKIEDLKSRIFAVSDRL